MSSLTKIWTNKAKQTWFLADWQVVAIAFNVKIKYSSGKAKHVKAEIYLGNLFWLFIFCTPPCCFQFYVLVKWEIKQMQSRRSGPSFPRGTGQLLCCLSHVCFTSPPCECDFTPSDALWWGLSEKGLVWKNKERGMERVHVPVRHQSFGA